MAIFSNPLFATYSVYARNASILIRSQSYRQTVVPIYPRSSPPARVITSAKEVMFSPALVSLFASRIMQKNLLDRFSQNTEKWRMGHGKPLDCGGNPDHALR